MGLKKIAKKISSAVKHATSGTGIGSSIKKAVGETTAKAIGEKNAAKLGSLLNKSGKATALLGLGLAGAGGAGLADASSLSTSWPVRAGLVAAPSLATSLSGRAMEKHQEETQAEEEKKEIKEGIEREQNAYNQNVSALEKAALMARNSTRTDYTSMRGLLGDYQTSEDNALDVFKRKRSF